MFTAQVENRPAATAESDPIGTGATVRDAVPLWPSLVAEIVVIPTPTVARFPNPSMVATDCALELHVTVRPGSGVPLASVSTADAWSPVAPSTIDGDEIVTATPLTGTAVAATLTSRYWVDDTDPRRLCVPTVEPRIHVA